MYLRLDLAGCGKTRFLHSTPRSAHVAGWYQNSAQDAQKGRPARPQRAKRRIVLLPYGESLNDARTPLADFFRILLDVAPLRSSELTIRSIHGELFARSSGKENLYGICPVIEGRQSPWCHCTHQPAGWDRSVCLEGGCHADVFPNHSL